jgi:phenylpyruvate tautomerase PptA (4-oxalocrotonate tautomerase family)
MPMIDLTLPQGALDDDQKQALVEKLVAAVRKWEGIADDPRAVATIRSFIDERPASAFACGGQAQKAPYYRIQLTVAEGVLDEERKAGLVAEVTQVILAAEGSSPDDPRNAARIWCHIHELPDGNWGAVGRIWRLPDMVQFSGIDPASVPGLRADSGAAPEAI